MLAARALALACLVLGAQVAPSQAYTLSLRQVGGTAVGGVGYVGDTVVVSIDMLLEAGDTLFTVAPSLRWDLEGGNVLDLVQASETSSVAGGALAPFDPKYRHGAVATLGDLYLNGSSFQALAGPSFAAGWEQSGVFSDTGVTTLAGPASFAVGRATFVFREVGETTVDFPLENCQAGIPCPLENNPWGTVVLDRVTNNVTGIVTYQEIDLAAFDFQPLRLTVVVPEPGSALLGGAGLLGLALASRTRATRRQNAR
jgi:hypothetical protein